MLLIDCPNCGLRPETEFRCGGQAHVARPSSPVEVNDENWAEYLFVRANPRGIHAERWVHQHGCGRWFNALRDTVSDRFVEIYPMGGQPTTKPGGEPSFTKTGGEPSTETQARA